jgi:transposase InsO family protein
MREMSVVEQRYRAVLEVQAGASVVEVAERYSVARQSVHRWLARYEAEGLAGLEDRSRRPRGHPSTLDGEVEALICELRREHRRWGPRRLEFELGRRGHDVARSTIYRVLVRNHLVDPKAGRRRRDEYVRWERSEPMQLWQLDVTASLFLVDGSESKIVTGVDDHSRFCVLAKVVRRGTARAVCLAFIEAIRTYGVPEEVLTDNARVFTGRFTRPMAAEVMFERICRENGITTRLTKPHSPTTTGKIERLHQSLQQELLDDHGPFESLQHAQRAVDGWRQEYNRDRPHQSLAMTTPAQRFEPKPTDGLELIVPKQLSEPLSPALDDEPDHAGSAWTTGRPRLWQPPEAVEVKREVPACGNMFVGGQQVWLGPALAGRVVTIWVDQSRLHVILDGHRLKTLPSRMGPPQLARLVRAGAIPAGPAPLPELAEHGDGIDVDRTVNASGLVSLAGRYYSIGYHLAGQRVTLRLKGNVMAVLAGNQLLRSLACTVAAQDRVALRGARPSPKEPLVVHDPISVDRRISPSGLICVATQRIYIGKAHAGKTVTVHVRPDILRVDIEPGLCVNIPRAGHKQVARFKVRANEQLPRVYPARKPREFRQPSTGNETEPMNPN